MTISQRTAVFIDLFLSEQTNHLQTKVGLLSLLCGWLSSCPVAVGHLLGDASAVPFVSLTALLQFAFITVFWTKTFTSIRAMNIYAAVPQMNTMKSLRRTKLWSEWLALLEVLYWKNLNNFVYIQKACLTTCWNKSFACRVAKKIVFFVRYP